MYIEFSEENVLQILRLVGRHDVNCEVYKYSVLLLEFSGVDYFCMSASA